MEYKVGDKVRIKSLDWYNENKDEYGSVICHPYVFLAIMCHHCGAIRTINSVDNFNKIYKMKEDGCHFDWTDEMIDCLVERNGKTYPYKIGDRVILKGNNRCATITDLKYNSWGNLSYYIKIDNDKDISIDYPTELLLPYDNMIEISSEEIEREHEEKMFSEGYDQGYEDGQHDMNEWVLPEGFQFKDENGNVINAQKIVLEKKDNDYPKTYEECVEILGRSADVTYGYKKYVLHILQMLLVCRDAYWQIAGQEMGLDDPWEPDYKNPDIDLYVIINSYNQVDKAKYGYGFPVRIFTFPTEKMREAFYENFKKEIEICKELL